MSRSSESTAADYNPPPRRAKRPLILAGVLLGVAAIVFPFDGPISAWVIEHVKPRGDFKRELETLQQFGQGSSLVITVLVVYLLDRQSRRRLLDVGMTMALTGVAVNVMKLLIGRPRPRPQFNDPAYFLGPFGQYPISSEVGVRHAWEIGSGISSDLWSMPSSHTAYAVALAVCLSRLYPRLAPLVVVLAGIVGSARVLLQAHWPSDALIGAAVGVLIAIPAMDGNWGQRVFARRPGAPGPSTQETRGPSV